MVFSIESLLTIRLVPVKSFKCLSRLCLICLTICNFAVAADIPRLLLISFDGFRADYINPRTTPHLYRLSRKGVVGSSMKSVFATKTMPNHFSIVTGLYEETHGIVNNVMFDPIFNETFHANTTGVKWWDNNSSIPIWVANEVINDDLERFSGVMMWPGSSTPIRGHLAKYLQPYDKRLTWNSRIDMIMDWFTRPKDPANLVVAYFDEPDSTAHHYGPFSYQVKEQIARIDAIMNNLIQRLDATGLSSSVNLILVSDHGMAEVKRNRIVILNSFIDPDLYDLHGTSPNYGIIPKPGKEDQVHEILKNHSITNHFTVYKKLEIPYEYHYRYNRRILTLNVVADEGYEMIKDSKDMWFIPSDTWGQHGYNNSLPSMRPLFLAAGPSFKVNYTHQEEFENIDIYPMMCLLLKLLPLHRFPSNGSLERISNMLLPITHISSSTENWFPMLLIFVGLSLLIVFGGACFVICAGLGAKKAKPDFNLTMDVVDIDLYSHIQNRRRSLRLDSLSTADKDEKHHLLDDSDDEDRS